LSATLNTDDPNSIPLSHLKTGTNPAIAIATCKNRRYLSTARTFNGVRPAIC